jgi:Uri superfamily endonuclease
MDKGIYCLIFENPACTVRVGALGDITFDKGWHIYIGSALGSGGLKRLDRHIALFKNKDRRPKWHVDYLTTDPRFRLTSAISAITTSRLECRLAGTLGGTGIPGFGCSDCSCTSHLLYRARNPIPDIRAAFRSLGLSPSIKTIMRDETKATV